MPPLKILACILSSLVIISCASRNRCCELLDVQPGEVVDSDSLKSTSLTYLINYGVDSYDVVASFDVRFTSGTSSTNGCTAHIQGRYGEQVKSNEIILKSRESGISRGQLTQSTVSTRKYYLTGVINRPDTEEIRQRNKRALSLHVEESYLIDYVLK